MADVVADRAEVLVTDLAGSLTKDLRNEDGTQRHWVPSFRSDREQGVQPIVELPRLPRDSFFRTTSPLTSRPTHLDPLNDLEDAQESVKRTIRVQRLAV